MLDLRVEREVRTSPELAFSFVAESFFENHHRWDPAVMMERDGDGPVAVGATGRERRRFLGEQTAAIEVTAFERPRRFAFRTTSGPFALERAYEFSQAGTGTALTFSFRMQPKRVLLRMLFPLMRPIVARQVHANIDRLTRLLDERAQERVP